MPDPFSPDPSAEPESRPRRRVKRDGKVVAMPGAKAPPPRELPHSLDAEERLLACCFLDGADMVPRCRAAKLSPDSFYEPKHGVILEAIYALHDAQQATTTDVVAEYLRTARKLDEIGGPAFLVQVSARIPTTAEAGYFLEQVRQQWILRQIIRRAERLSARAYDYAGEPLSEFLSPDVVWFESALARLAHGGRGDVYTLKTRIAEVVADVKLRAEGREDRSRWVWTGFPAFDETQRSACLRPLGSLEEDHNVLIGGGSSQGKSVLMRQLAGQAVLSGQSVVVYTLETTVKGFIRSLAASWAEINLLALDRMPRDRLQKFEDYCAELMEVADKRLFIFQHEPAFSLRTIEEVGTHARRFAMQHGAPHLMLLDYMQLVGTKKRCGAREQEVAEVSNGWQGLQRELGCVAVAGAQLNEAGLREMRQVRRDEEGKVIHRMPNRGDLRESQSMYHAADVVWFLYQPPEDCTGRDQSDGNAATPESWIVQDKRRNGVRGICRTWFQKQFGRFREIGGDEAAGGSPRPAGPAPIPPGKRVSKADFRRPQP